MVFELVFRDYITEAARDAEWTISEGEYDYIIENHLDDILIDECIDDIIDALWTDDSVTGNGSGSYTFNGLKAKENIKDLIFDDEFLSELESLCFDLGKLLSDGAESVDVVARCCALGYARDNIAYAIEDRFDYLKDLKAESAEDEEE